jgi:hypothetical protein
MKNKNKITIITSIVLFAVAGYFLLFVKQSGDVQPLETSDEIGLLDTSDWVLYENEELGIRFRHPEGYESSYDIGGQFVHFVPTLSDEYPEFIVIVSTIDNKYVSNSTLKGSEQCKKYGQTSRVSNDVLMPDLVITLTGKYCIKKDGIFYYVLNYDDESYLLGESPFPDLGKYRSLSDIAFSRKNERTQEIQLLIRGKSQDEYYIKFIRTLADSIIEESK